MPPVRQITRHSIEYHLSSIATINKLSPGVNDEAIVALVILRVCLPDWLIAGMPARPLQLIRSCSVHSIGVSMNRSYSSVHRLVGVLLANGLVVRSRGGVAISNDPKISRRVIGFLEESCDLLMRFASSLHDNGAYTFNLGTRQWSTTLPSAAIATSLDLLLMPYETFQDQIGGWTTKKIWVVLSALTTRHITTDPDLDRYYAIRSTPNEQRRPVSRAAITELSYVPASSVWRHLRDMERSGIIAKKGDGWAIFTEHLLEKHMEQAVQASAAFYVRHLDELVSHGLDPSNVTYVHGKPPLLLPTS